MGLSKGAGLYLICSPIESCDCAKEVSSAASWPDRAGMSHTNVTNPNINVRKNLWMNKAPLFQPA